MQAKAARNRTIAGLDGPQSVMNARDPGLLNR
jgi:hypothetical protein